MAKGRKVRASRAAQVYVEFSQSPPEVYTLSLHDALPISCTAARRLLPARTARRPCQRRRRCRRDPAAGDRGARPCDRSEEHTSELQSRPHLVCRLLLEKKNF